MKDVLITVYGNGSVSTPSNMLIGYDGENIARKLIIKMDKFIDGIAMLEVRQNNKEYSLALEKEEETYFLPIKESLLAYPEIDMQFMLIVGEETVYKSGIFTFTIGESINATNKEIIKEYASFLATAKEKLETIDKVVSDLNEKIESGYFNGKDGEKGEPGDKGAPFLYGDFTEEQLENLRGPAGKDGTNGIDGKDGTNGLDGESGATFTPSIDEEGNLSWTNDKGLPNPDTVNIKGPQGPIGQAGANGQDGIVDYTRVNAYIDEKIGDINTILATLTTPPESEVSNANE